MSTNDSVFYLIVAAVVYLVATWIEDRVMQGYAVGVATVVAACAMDAWTKRKLLRK